MGNGTHDFSIIEMVENLIKSRAYFVQKSDSLERERDEAREESLEQARLLGISGERECRLIAERDEANKKYDIEATEHMLNINKCCNQRDEAMDALMKIEEIFIDGCDTYEDWKSMGQIARTFLEKTYESRTNQNN